MKGVTEKEYLKAKSIIGKYEIQCYKEEEKRINTAKEAQLKREQECIEHDFVDDSYKWGSPTRVRCILCGKIKND